MLNLSILNKLKFCFILGLIVLLAGCAHTYKDGPPGFNVDVTRIPNAKPKTEPLSRSGNKPYSVFGRKYFVMPSSKGYEERGIASWYGRKFHAHRTSNGERYDMLGMTAAHKSLPLPTYVQVTNLANGKKVIVKVNDRGPFLQNRLIDLSYAAAKKLGMVGHGTAYVDVKAIDPTIKVRPPSLMARAKGHYKFKTVKTTVTTKTTFTNPVYLQVGAFKSRSNAETLRRKLIGMTSSPVKVSLLNHYYRVQVGPFHDTTAATRFNQQLKSQRVLS